MRGLKGATTPILKSDMSSSLVIASTGVVYTRSFELFNGEYFGLWCKVVSATGTPDIKIDLEQTALRVAESGEGVANTALWAVTQAVTAGVNDEVAHIIKLSPIPMSFGRLKITGINSNPADSIFTGYNFIQE